MTYGPQERAQITAVVCEPLWKRKLPLSRFSNADLRRVVIQEEGLASHGHKQPGVYPAPGCLWPWRYRYWLFPRAPDFVSRACVILDLYADFVMSQAPYQPSVRVIWIVDGGCAHHRNTFLARLRGTYANIAEVERSDPHADRSTSS